MSDDLIRKYVDLWGLKPEETTAYLCGHPEMVENGRGNSVAGGLGQDGDPGEEYYFQPDQRGEWEIAANEQRCSRSRPRRKIPHSQADDWGSRAEAEQRRPGDRDPRSSERLLRVGRRRPRECQLGPGHEWSLRGSTASIWILPSTMATWT